MPAEVDLLILGAGWTATFLIPLLQSRSSTFAATTRDGRKVAGIDTIPWTFDPSKIQNADGKNQFARLPSARAVLLTFPLTGSGQSSTLVHGYSTAHGDGVHFVQLGSTGIWQITQPAIWVNRKSPYDMNNRRAMAEDELLGLGGSVINLAGLWGGERNPRDWVDRVAKTKDEVRGKKSLHLIHGHDVARAIVAVVLHWDKAKGQRWMLTDGIVYDWWTLFVGWADRKNEADGDTNPSRGPSKQAQWVYELLVEDKVLALPRSMEQLGRCYDGRDFWSTFSLTPLRARV